MLVIYTYFFIEIIFKILKIIFIFINNLLLTFCNLYNYLFYFNKLSKYYGQQYIKIDFNSIMILFKYNYNFKSCIKWESIFFPFFLLLKDLIINYYNLLYNVYINYFFITSLCNDTLNIVWFTLWYIADYIHYRIENSGPSELDDGNLEDLDNISYIPSIHEPNRSYVWAVIIFIFY